MPVPTRTWKCRWCGYPHEIYESVEVHEKYCCVRPWWQINEHLIYICPWCQVRGTNSVSVSSDVRRPWEVTCHECGCDFLRFVGGASNILTEGRGKRAPITPFLHLVHAEWDRRLREGVDKVEDYKGVPVGRFCPPVPR